MIQWFPFFFCFFVFIIAINKSNRKSYFFLFQHYFTHILLDNVTFVLNQLFEFYLDLEQSIAMELLVFKNRYIFCCLWVFRFISETWK